MKDRKLRYQNAADIRTDLKQLRQESESAKAAHSPESPTYERQGKALESDSSCRCSRVHIGEGRLCALAPQADAH